MKLSTNASRTPSKPGLTWPSTVEWSSAIADMAPSVAVVTHEACRLANVTGGPFRAVRRQSPLCRWGKTLAGRASFRPRNSVSVPPPLANVRSLRFRQAHTWRLYASYQTDHDRVGSVDGFEGSIQHRLGTH